MLWPFVQVRKRNQFKERTARDSDSTVVISEYKKESSTGNLALHMCTDNTPSLWTSYAHFLLLFSPSLPLFLRSFLLQLATEDTKLHYLWHWRIILAVRTLISEFHFRHPMTLQLKKLPRHTRLLIITQDLQNLFLYFYFISLLFIIIHCTYLLCLHVYSYALFSSNIKSIASQPFGEDQVILNQMELDYLLSSIKEHLFFSLFHRNIHGSCFQSTISKQTPSLTLAWDSFRTRSH